VGERVASRALKPALRLIASVFVSQLRRRGQIAFVGQNRREPFKAPAIGVLLNPSPADTNGLVQSPMGLGQLA